MRRLQSSCDGVEESGGRWSGHCSRPGRASEPGRAMRPESRLPMPRGRLAQPQGPQRSKGRRAGRDDPSLRAGAAAGSAGPQLPAVRGRHGIRGRSWRGRLRRRQQRQGGGVRGRGDIGGPAPGGTGARPPERRGFGRGAPGRGGWHWLHL